MDGPIRTLTQYWDGKSWQIVASPNGATGGSVLNAVVAVSANDVWAVGWIKMEDQEQQLLLLHWTGKFWQRVEIEVPQPQGIHVVNAIAIDHNQTWMVGYTVSENLGRTTFIEGCL